MTKQKVDLQDKGTYNLENTETSKNFDKEAKEKQAEIQAEHEAKNYIRVGTVYYYIGNMPTAKGGTVKVIKKWQKSTIKEDHTSRVIGKIKTYFGFITMPDHSENFKREIDGYYNLYEPLNYKPEKGDLTHTTNFLKHIFGEYFPIGIDYLKVLYQFPTQNLPTICLVSKENETGKSTFLKLLREIFGDNAVILGNEDFSSNFNSHWATKLIVGIDEGFIEKRIIKEKIKRLVTDDSILIENKGVDKARVDFFGKFILLSNNEENFIQMDKEDTRFFVLKVPSIPAEKKDPELMEKLKSEVPALLAFLKLPPANSKKSRLWFTPDQYETPALKNVVRNTKTMLEKLIASHLVELADLIAESEPNLKSIELTPKDIFDEIKQQLSYSNGLNLKIAEVFKKWGFNPNTKSSRYKKPVIRHNEVGTYIDLVSNTGRYYTITLEYINEELDI